MMRFLLITTVKYYVCANFLHPMSMLCDALNVWSMFQFYCDPAQGQGL